MRAYVTEGRPYQIEPILEELRQIEGVIIHKVHEQHEVIPGIGRQVSFVQVIFFAIDDEVADYLALKYPPNVFRLTSS
jgi:hypothetical protein